MGRCGAGCRDRMRPRAGFDKGIRPWSAAVASQRACHPASSRSWRSTPSSRARASRARNRVAKPIVRPRSASSGLTRRRRASATTAKSRSPIATSGSPASAAQSSPRSASAQAAGDLLDPPSACRTASSATGTVGVSSKPIRAGRFCTPCACASAGSAAGTPSRSERRSRFSAVLSFSQFTTTPAGPSTVTSPKTCGWRWIILARTSSATSPMSKPSVRLHRDGAVHEHLEQQIAELLAQRPGFDAVDCLEHLVGLLEEVGAKAAMRLLAVPRASTRGAQPLDHLVERAQRVDGLVTHARSAPQPARAAARAPGGPARAAPA